MRLALSYFGENQLYPGSIGISPLSTPHPPPFQRGSVRSSIGFYPNFILDMDRSPGFGSIACNSRAVHTRFPCGSGSLNLNLAAYNNSPDHSTKGTTSHFNVLCVLVSTRFQVLFHSPPGVLFTFPSRYYSTIGHQVVFRLGRWSSRIPTGFHVSGGTLDTHGLLRFSRTGLSPSMVGFPTPFC